MESRYTDRSPIVCTECSWKGRVQDCIHGYEQIGEDEVEPMDYCPNCGSRFFDPDLFQIALDLLDEALANMQEAKMYAQIASMDAAITDILAKEVPAQFNILRGNFGLKWI
jgi:hypothetical protein